MNVSDNHNNRIQKFARDGKFITNWGTEGSGDGQLRGPRELSVSSSGKLYVSDGGIHRFDVFAMVTDTTTPCFKVSTFPSIQLTNIEKTPLI